MCSCYPVTADSRVQPLERSLAVDCYAKEGAHWLSDSWLRQPVSCTCLPPSAWMSSAHLCAPHIRKKTEQSHHGSHDHSVLSLRAVQEQLQYCGEAAAGQGTIDFFYHSYTPKLLQKRFVHDMPFVFLAFFFRMKEQFGAPKENRQIFYADETEPPQVKALIL